MPAGLETVSPFRLVCDICRAIRAYQRHHPEVRAIEVRLSPDVWRVWTDYLDDERAKHARFVADGGVSLDLDTSGQPAVRVSADASVPHGSWDIRCAS